MADDSPHPTDALQGAVDGREVTIRLAFANSLEVWA
jgi:hypothetical protein